MRKNNEEQKGNVPRWLNKIPSIAAALGCLGIAVIAGVDILHDDSHSPEEVVASITFDNTEIAQINEDDLGVVIAGLGGLVVGGLLTSSIIPGSRGSKE